MLPQFFEDIEDEENFGLEVENRDGLSVVRWKGFDLTFQHATDNERHLPLARSVARATPGFSTFGGAGYGLQGFAEFLIRGPGVWDPSVQDLHARIGGIRVSIGDPTPVARYLFLDVYDNDYHPEWENIRSVRLLGAESSNAEALFLFVLGYLNEKYQIRLNPVSLTPLSGSDLDALAALDTNTEPKRVADDDLPVITDIEPLRIFARGLAEDDDSYAFLQFYRVLEFYMFSAMRDEIEELRKDESIESREFIARFLKVIPPQNERMVIIRLVDTMGKHSLAKATKLGIHAENLRALGENLYSYRNSVAHAKIDYRSEIYAPPYFEQDEQARNWRRWTQWFAWNVLTRFGRTDLDVADIAR